MASVSTYLTFDGTCEEAFTFYASVFGAQLPARIMRMGDIPPEDGESPVPPEEADLVMHLAIPILGGHLLMGSDALVSRGRVVKPGNAIQVTLNCDDVDQLNHLYFALSEGAVETYGPTRMFWGDEYATVTDRYGTHWMLVSPAEPQANQGTPA